MSERTHLRGPCVESAFGADMKHSCYRGISFLLTSILFHIVPTALEISMVCGILVSCLVKKVL